MHRDSQLPVNGSSPRTSLYDSSVGGKHNNGVNPIADVNERVAWRNRPGLGELDHEVPALHALAGGIRLLDCCHKVQAALASGITHRPDGTGIGGGEGCIH